MKTLTFPYRRFKVPPQWSLEGRAERPRCVLDVTIIGPTNTIIRAATLDTGADDTVLPIAAAALIGIDLTAAPTGSASGVGGVVGTLRFAIVTLRITDGKEFCEWPARVGFTTTPLKLPLLGFAGVLQFFRAVFDGDLEQVELTTNRHYPGT